MAMARAHLWISGRVQGVGYRLSIQGEAERLGLTGWVRNLTDGRVEAVAEGDEATLTQLIAWCRQGPPGARVDSVRELSEPTTGGLTRFSIAATA